PVGLYRQLSSGRAGTFILESATDGQWSRWSFIGVSARAILTEKDGRAHWSGDVPASVPAQGNILEVLRATLAALHTPSLEHLPPLTGGLVGSLGWDIVHQWEPTLPRHAADEHGLPEVSLALVADMAAIDHHTGDLWLIANAINADDTDDRVDQAHADAVARLDAMQQQLVAPTRSYALAESGGAEPELHFRTEREDYTRGVHAAKRAIEDGDVFQVVLSQRLDLDCPAHPLEVYRVLRTINPSPYMYFLHLADAHGQDVHVVGSSPETLVKVTGRDVHSYPIAGSRPRGQTPAEDHAAAAELLQDPKEKAEHLMLVDLARNDLGKVCRPGSVTVAEFMDIKRFSHIMHMSSTVTGQLRPEAESLDVLMATFPAGTLSGAPKTRAIALIDELEPARRGFYGGTVGYFDLDGDLDMAIAIRTAVISDGRASVQAGGGLVADSDPETEYWETRNKAAAAVRAVQRAARSSVL
ncbi:MAG TPA: anthranilate synthase component I, partial [Ruania sp.]|nr:anthranilate synthase component I [Ruania sp.]